MRIGVDLGGTKIEGVVLNENQVVARLRVATPQGNYAATLDAVSALVDALEQQIGQRALPLGLGHPGSIDPHSGLLRNANSVCLNGRALKQDLEARLDRPLALANDANCLALSELHDGAARGLQSAFLVILGTGVGGAVVANGQLQQGFNGLGGEWGHNPLPWVTKQELPGTACWCGQHGCLETWLSGPALSLLHANAGGIAGDARAIVAQAEQGDAIARASLEAYSHRLARALAAVINLLDPQIIVLAGGLSQVRTLYHDVPALWSRWVFADQVQTPLVPAFHGDASGALGAARLGIEC